MKVLMQVLEVLHARLAIQTEENSRTHTSIDRAAAALANALGSATPPETRRPTPAVEPEESVSTSTVRQLIDDPCRRRHPGASTSLQRGRAPTGLSTPAVLPDHVHMAPLLNG
jgi:hypothetical protein